MTKRDVMWNLTFLSFSVYNEWLMGDKDVAPCTLMKEMILRLYDIGSKASKVKSRYSHH